MKRQVVLTSLKYFKNNPLDRFEKKLKSFCPNFNSEINLKVLKDLVYIMESQSRKKNNLDIKEQFFLLNYHLLKFITRFHYSNNIFYKKLIKMISIYLDHSNSRSLQSTFINFSTTLEAKDLKPSCSCKKMRFYQNFQNK